LSDLLLLRVGLKFFGRIISSLQKSNQSSTSVVVFATTKEVDSGRRSLGDTVHLALIHKPKIPHTFPAERAT
jgi:hypothetical protein